MGDYQQFLAAHPAISTLTEGVGRGFLLYFIPYSVLRREVKKKVMRRALAFGTFCGVVRLIRYYTQHQDEKQAAAFADAADDEFPLMHRAVKYLEGSLYRFPCEIAGIAGTIAGLLLDPSLRHSQLLALWMMVRAARCVTPAIPYASTATMCLSSAQILSTYARAPDQLDPSYLKFLKIHGGQGPETLHVMLHRNDLLSLCPTIHPGRSCPSYWVHFFGKEAMRAVKVYAPLYVVFFLFSRTKNISHVVQNIVRSTIFLSLYCTLAWASGCLFHRLFRVNVSRGSLLAHAGFAGLATLVERPVRSCPSPPRPGSLAHPCVEPAARARGLLLDLRLGQPGEDAAGIWARAAHAHVHARAVLRGAGHPGAPPQAAAVDLLALHARGRPPVPRRRYRAAAASRSRGPSRRQTIKHLAMSPLPHQPASPAATQAQEEDIHG